MTRSTVQWTWSQVYCHSQLVQPPGLWNSWAQRPPFIIHQAEEAKMQLSESCDSNWLLFKSPGDVTARSLIHSPDDLPVTLSLTRLMIQHSTSLRLVAMETTSLSLTVTLSWLRDI